MTGSLETRIADWLARPVEDAVAAFARRLGDESGALAVLFYGSNLRTRSLDGVLDYYVLLPGQPEKGIWPRVSYHEWKHEVTDLRAKVATMTLAKFQRAAAGELVDTTIWARFVQPSALVWSRDPQAGEAVTQAIAAACRTAGRLAAALGPEQASEAEYWTALFRATYRAEFRVESAGREQSILGLNPGHFEGLLPLALASAGITFDESQNGLDVRLAQAERERMLRWWDRRRRLGKPLNLIRLVRASATFDGAARYAAWKIERHTGVKVHLTPWRERHPILAAPGVLWSVWRARRKQRAALNP